MTTPVASAAPPAPSVEPLPYGWRLVERPGANGKVEYDQVPLSLEDVLHPQEGDEIPEHPVHNTERDYIKRACRSRLHGVRGVLVLSDCLIHWGSAGIRALSPDVSVIFNVPDTHVPGGMFYTAREGTRPRLVVEIVSPHTRSNDVTKITLYHQLGIPDYVMIDQQRENGPRSLVHYHWEQAGYRTVPGSENGVLLQCANVRLCLRDNGAVCFDATTGEEILDYHDLEEQRNELEEAHDKLQQERDDLAKERDEVAEERDDLAKELKAAEREIQDQTRAREDAERRLRDLEAELHRLRGEPPA
jgi:colicin import membrane protein